MGNLLAQTGADGKKKQDAAHKFDVKFSQEMTQRRRVADQNGSFMRFIKTLRAEMDEKELIRLLKSYSSELGREVGRRQAQNAPDTKFQTFVATFRPPNYEDLLTLEIVEDTKDVFQLRVTECIWASTFIDAGLGGEIGHAAVCHMDYSWPQAFNPSFRMERNKTLMQGHDHCNHRYLAKA
jgi:hypothetical protein